MLAGRTLHRFSRMSVARFWSTVLASVLLMTSVSAMTTTASGSIQSANPNCCSLNLMDSGEQVVIETARQFTPGTYQTIKALVCTADTIYVQLWRASGTGTYVFRQGFQLTLDPSSSYAFVNTPFVLTTDDRLGLYDPSSTILKFPIPYDSVSNGALYYSQSRYTSAASFTNGTTITLNTLKWARTFSNNIQFCATLGCAGNQVMATSPAPVSSGLAGPPGPPGPPGPCCATPTCDPSSINSNMNSQGQQITDLQDTLANMNSLLQQLSSSTVASGYCPNNMMAGTYGIGSCYVIVRTSVQMGQADIRCHDDYNADLVDIESSTEEAFLHSAISNSSQPGVTESFWTSGMYNSLSREWYWATSSDQLFNYRDWENDFEPTPYTDADICVILTLNKQLNIDYWSNTFCTYNNYYICEIPKACN